MGNLIARHARIPGIAVGILALGIALTGCGNSSSVKRDESGKPTASQTADAFSVKVGDCIKNPEKTTVTDVTVIPCDQPHDYEAFARQNMAGTTDYPGEDAATTAAQTFCKPAFEEFVGLGFDESTLELQYFYPTSESWKQKDREIMCLVAGPSGEQTTGTLKSAKK